MTLRVMNGAPCRRLCEEPEEAVADAGGRGGELNAKVVGAVEPFVLGQRGSDSPDEGEVIPRGSLRVAGDYI